MTTSVYISQAGEGLKNGTFGNAYDDTNANWQAIATNMTGTTHVYIAEGTYSSFSQNLVFSGFSGSATEFNFIEVVSSGWASGNYTATLNMNGSYRAECSLAFMIFKGLIFTNATLGFYSASGMTNSYFLNCGFNSNTTGFWAGNNYYSYFDNCTFNNNTNPGLYVAVRSVFRNCKFRGNGSHGIDGNTTVQYCTLINCEITDNGGYGWSVVNVGNYITKSVIDNNTSGGIRVGSDMAGVDWCKITNNGGYGIEYTTKSLKGIHHLYFFNNTTGTINFNSLYDTSNNLVNMSADYYTDDTTGDYTSIDGDESVGNGVTIGNDYTIYESVFPSEYSSGGGGNLIDGSLIQ